MKALNYAAIKNSLNRLLFISEKQISPIVAVKSTSLREYLLLGGFLVSGLYFANKEKKMKSWIYRDDIGAPNGIHGYEEMVNSVGQHHGHYHWTQERTFSTFNSATYFKLIVVFEEDLKFG